MQIQQLYTNCLAHGAYYLESNGEAAIIDPLREVQQYIDLAAQRNATIKYVFETHFHADFVSGHIDLAKKTGATIVYGPTTAQTGFEMYVAKDKEVFTLGNITLTLLHTPGHTLESSCLLLTNEHGKQTAIFTGDTLFIGDVGRPDLAQHVIADLTQDKLARLLYHSLRNSILPLPDDLIVYPAHGAGSACGKNLSKETSDTLGNQKKTNYALNTLLTEDTFVNLVLTGLTPPPAYFPKNVLMNIGGYNAIDEVMDRGTRALSVAAFEAALAETNALVLDTRNPDEFAKGFIPGAISIGLNGNFAVWAGTLIKNIKQPILLVTETGKEQEAVTRLARVGYDGTIGFLNGGFKSWLDAGKETDTITSISANEFETIYAKNNGIQILDVRKESEFFSEHIIGAVNAPLDFVDESMLKVNTSQPAYIHCAGGYRSIIFISMLKAKGYANLVNVAGGFAALKALNKLPITDYVCPTTML